MRHPIPGISLCLLLAATAALLVGGAEALSRHRMKEIPRPFGELKYHDHRPETALPPTLDARLFPDKSPAFVAYKLAAQIEEVLYQVPCYCACNRTQGHQSLLDCFTSDHGAKCPICQREAIFCSRQHKLGKSAEQIRAALAKGKAWKIDLVKAVVGR